MADNKQMILNLFGGMQDALFLGDRFSQGEFVAFMQPGQFVSDKLKESDSSDDMAVISDVSNAIVDSQYVAKYKGTDYSNGLELLGSVSEVYADILRFAAIPYAPLSPSDLLELNQLRTWIANNTPNYELYRNRYFDALDAYEIERMSQNPDGARLRRLKRIADDAFHMWELIGSKREYDIKVGRFIYLTPVDPQTYWAELQGRYRDHERVAPKLGTYQQTFLQPSISNWSSSSWATYENIITEKDQYSYSKQTSWSGSVSGAWGLWSFGGGASGSTDYRREQADESSVNLKFEYLRVRINRPWMIESVLGYRFWTWKKTVGHTAISDGGNLNVDPPLRPIGRMPVLPKYLIVVRNVELSAAFSHTVYERYHREVSYNASVGWGPFSVSGSYRESSTSVYTHASFDGVKFLIQQPQIVARSGLLLPTCPNPDKSLPWQNDAWLPGSLPAEFENLSGIREGDYEKLVKLEREERYRREASRLADLFLSQRLAESGFDFAAYSSEIVESQGFESELTSSDVEDDDL
jgi:hypothetical protein